MLTAPGANVTHVDPSTLVAVPPAVGVMSSDPGGGGERPLAVPTVGLGGVPVVPVGATVLVTVDWVVVPLVPFVVLFVPELPAVPVVTAAVTVSGSVPGCSVWGDVVVDVVEVGCDRLLTPGAETVVEL